MPSVMPALSKLLPRLPIPPLEETLERYLDRLEPLQSAQKHQDTVQIVQSEQNKEVLAKLHESLVNYDKELAHTWPKSSYIQQFWYDAYLEFDESVVLNVNPHFLLQDDPTLRNLAANWLAEGQAVGPFGRYAMMITRAAKLVYSTLKFVREIRQGTLTPDSIRGRQLSMDQYDRLFGSARVPPLAPGGSCQLQTDPTSHHIVVMFRSQFYWFDVLDRDNNPIFQTYEQLEWNLFSIVSHGAEQNPAENCAGGIYPWGVFTTENRRVWSNVRDYIAQSSNSTNRHNLRIIDSALFVLCLDDVAIEDPAELVKSMLCGTSEIKLTETGGLNGPCAPKSHHKSGPLGVQQGTCLNRWYDKLQLIVTLNGKAGFNFEHTGIDGHTVLRLTTDLYTDSILSFAQGITKDVPSVFHAPAISHNSAAAHAEPNLITIPRKLEWCVDSFLLSSLHFSETRVSDLIYQFEFAVLDFDNYGASHIKSALTCSPDAFIQMAIQVAFYALYGKFEMTYEPAMTKSFQNGRTEAIRSVSHQSKAFVRSMFSTTTSDKERVNLLHAACREHSRITRECSAGFGQDRHLYALYCTWKAQFSTEMEMPPIFADQSWTQLNTNVISTSNCGNPSLKSFGFGPVCANGFGIGYIIRNNSISIVASSKHRQTKRFVSLIECFLKEIDKICSNSRTNTSSMHSDGLGSLLSGYDYFDVSTRS
ncbi:LAMI_0E15852g1_1 [Lachancea mirantina]|uniref:LAMI_0E15852g1_1 n=1 Tax=Lachancea mirantina TaxID=1230905 RepID=A0A1G4JSM8_9SACH|nr:LAMI_0E15852g1_1 [Lachancea mirantina]